MSFPIFLGGVELAISSFAENGWQTRPRRWSEKSEETLAEMIGETAVLPPSEADELATRILGQLKDEWIERGGQADDASANAIVFIIFLAIAVLVAFGVFGMVAMVAWLT